MNASPGSVKVYGLILLVFIIKGLKMNTSVSTLVVYVGTDIILNF